MAAKMGRAKALPVPEIDSQPAPHRAAPLGSYLGKFVSNLLIK